MKPLHTQPWARLIVFLLLVVMAMNWTWRTYQPVQLFPLTAERAVIPDGDARKGIAGAVFVMLPLLTVIIINGLLRRARSTTRLEATMNGFDHFALFCMAIAELVRGSREAFKDGIGLIQEWYTNKFSFWKHAPRAAMCLCLMLCTAIISGNYAFQYMTT